jgi:hypothetical protein
MLYKCTKTSSCTARPKALNLPSTVHACRNQTTGTKPHLRRSHAVVAQELHTTASNNKLNSCALARTVGRIHWCSAVLLHTCHMLAPTQKEQQLCRHTSAAANIASAHSQSQQRNHAHKCWVYTYQPEPRTRAKRWCLLLLLLLYS